MADAGEGVVPYQEKKLKITVYGADKGGTKYSLGEISFDMAEYVGATKR